MKSRIEATIVLSLLVFCATKNKTMVHQRLIMVLVFLLLSFLARAEYNGWYITFEITTTANQKITGHTYKAMAYFNQDSIQRSSYLIKHLNHAGLNSEEQRFSYARHLLKYSYSYPGDTAVYSAYTLVDEDSIPISAIKDISINKMIDFGYLLNISSAHTIGDTIWMKEPVLESAFIGGYLCEFTVYVHQQSQGVEEVLKEIEIFNTKNEKQFNDWENELEYLNGKEREDLEHKMEHYQESLDEKATEILEKLVGEEVVIISFCSC
jgi:hypothetical protein